MAFDELRDRVEAMPHDEMVDYLRAELNKAIASARPSPSSRSGTDTAT